MPDLPPGLSGPVDLALAAASDDVPLAGALRGGSVYEPKWDGFRLAVVRRGAAVRLWSRSGSDLTRAFPEIAEAAVQDLPSGCVVDGEVVLWDGGRLHFQGLLPRLGMAPDRALREAAARPSSFVAFDALAVGDRDVRGWPWWHRRAVLEKLGPWRPPLQLCPVTDDRDLALQWFDDYAAAGLEGLVVKGRESPYEPGRRRWVKVKRRASTEVVVGAVIGPLHRPRVVVGGRYDNGRLVMVGQSTQLGAALAKDLAAVLTAASPSHPWPSSVPVQRFGTGQRVALTRVEPLVVAEVAVDSAVDAGRFRHPFRMLRLRPDVPVGDVPPLL